MAKDMMRCARGMVFEVEDNTCKNKNYPERIRSGYKGGDNSYPDHTIHGRRPWVVLDFFEPNDKNDLFTTVRVAPISKGHHDYHTEGLDYIPMFCVYENLNVYILLDQAKTINVSELQGFKYILTELTLLKIDYALMRRDRFNVRYGDPEKIKALEMKIKELSDEFDSHYVLDNKNSSSNDEWDDDVAAAKEPVQTSQVVNKPVRKLENIDLGKRNIQRDMSMLEEDYENFGVEYCKAAYGVRNVSEIERLIKDQNRKEQKPVATSVATVEKVEKLDPKERFKETKISPETVLRNGRKPKEIIEFYRAHGAKKTKEKFDFATPGSASTFVYTYAKKLCM